MTISTILDVAIGLAFTYVLLSVLCSGVNEWIAQSTGRRGRFLREGLLNLLSDRWFYLRVINHPLVAAHRRDSAGKAQNPSYLPSDVVAKALLDVLVLRANQLDGKSAPDATPDFDSVRSAAARCHKEGLLIGRAILPLLDQANKDLAVASTSVATWYDSSMQRVSGWYKKSSRISLFVVGTVLAVILNVDSIELTRALATSDSLREASVKNALDLVATGQFGGIQIVKDGVPLTPAPVDIKSLIHAGENLEEKGLPIGFSCLASALEKGGAGLPTIGEVADGCWKALKSSSGAQRVSRVIGWFITALALALGAPFWFDLLNRLVDLRGAGAKPSPGNKSGETDDRNGGKSSGAGAP